MRHLYRLLPILFFFVFAPSAYSQNCLSTGLNGTSLNLPCGVNCTQLSFKVPHLKSSSDYRIVTIPYAPSLPLTSPTATEVTSIYQDDKFSVAYTLPFSFCFYDSLFTQFVVGSNGVVTFDVTNATCSNAWLLHNSGTPVPIPFVGTGGCSDASGPKYPKYSIMSPMHDINPNTTNAGNPDRKIEWRLEGTAPCRKLVATFNNIALFGNSTQYNTSQIIIYESTGLIDIFIKDKTRDTDASPWNNDLAILGIQKDATKANAVAGKNATAFAETNTGYRFVPSGPVSRFVRSELYNMSGTLLATTTPADTTTTQPGLLDVSFNNVCQTAQSQQYVIKTFFSSCSDPTSNLISTDTVTVNKTAGLQATSTTTAAACGPNGSITVNIPPGAGALPYTLTLNGGTPIVVNAQTHTFNALTAGTYTINITSPGACAQTMTVTVASSGVLSVTPNVTPTSCTGAANGSFTITPNNGMAPFQYQINNGAWQNANSGNAHNFTGLPAGIYLVGVKDASGCVLTNYQVQIISGPPIQAGVSALPPSCAGAANGSLTITPNTGTSPYTYNINNGAYGSTNVFGNLPPGNYLIGVRDAQGCFVNITGTVPTSSGSLTANLAASGTSCAGVSNGSITITPTSGSGPYQYSVNGGAFVTGTTIPNLAPGTYSVVVKDGAGCTSQPISATVTQGSALLATTASTVATCSGVNNGSITVTPTNGSGPYTYALDGGTAQTSNVFTNVSAGNHTVVVTDGAGCVSAPITVAVGVGAAIAGTTAINATSCAGATNGSVTVTPSNGVAPYTFSINGGSFQTSATFTGLAAGSHSIVIRDNVGCTSAPINITVAAGAPLTGTVAVQPTSCNTAADGSATLTPTSGSAPYTYSVDGGAFGASATFNGLTAGAHNFVIRDAAGCTTAPIPGTVAAGPALTATAVATPTSCNGATNGTVTVTTTNGTGPFQYSLDAANFQASNVFSGLAPGTYNVTYRNAAGCTGFVTATVVAGAPLSAAVNVTAVLCNGGSTGTATVNINSTAIATYQYSLDGTTWQSSNVFNGLAAGAYTAYFRDNNNCSGTQPFTVTQPAVLGITATSQAVLCNGQSNGVITATATGGTTPYQYSINGTTWQAANTFNVAAGSYTVQVRDANGCTQSQALTVAEPAQLTATSVTTPATCAGGADGTITVTANGGTTGYQYSLNGTTWQGSNVLYAVPGSYTVSVKDANGCTVTTNAVVGLNNNLTLAPMADATICEGSSVQLSPQTNATVFAWTPSAGLSAANIAQPIASPTTTTQYVLTATLGNCSARDTVVVNVNPAPVANAGPDGDICYGQTYQLQGSGGIGYEWTPSTYLSSNATLSPVVTPAQTTTYSLHVTDANGCRSLQADQVIVKVTPPIVVRLNRDTVVATGDQLQLNATSAGTNYLWSPSAGLSNPAIPNPVATITSDVTYKVTVTTSAGCKGEGTVVIRVFNGPEIYVPTAFTPNGDGLNDVFTPFPVGIKYYTYFRVYNRWGQVIFSTNAFNRGWDGRLGGREQPTGTYVWMIEGVDKFDRKISKKGTIQLIR